MRVNPLCRAFFLSLISSSDRAWYFAGVVPAFYEGHSPSANNKTRRVSWRHIAYSRTDLSAIVQRASSCLTLVFYYRFKLVERSKSGQTEHSKMLECTILRGAKLQMVSRYKISLRRPGQALGAPGDWGDQRLQSVGTWRWQRFLVLYNGRLYLYLTPPEEISRY